MTRSPKIHVAGAGAFGLACAVELAKDGAQVQVFDPAPPGANASGVAAGMIAPAFEAVLDAAARPHLDLLLAARALWPDFAVEHGIELDRRGAMAVGDAARLESLTTGFQALGLPVETLGPNQARALAPGLAQTFEGGLFTDLDWRIEAAGALAALRTAASSLGVTFRTERLEGLGDADQVVIATGADLSLCGLAPELSRLTPIKGHILRLPAAAYAGVVVRGPDGYAAPAEGGLTVGATMESGVGDTVVDPVQAARLLAAGQAMFPGLVGTDQVRAVVGVRAATPDGLPMIGAGLTQRVLLAVGARRNGWLLAPLAGRIIAAMVADADPGMLAARLAPGRAG